MPEEPHRHNPERELPAFIAENLDESDREMLTENDWEGVPLPYSLQLIEMTAEWVDRIQQEGAPPDLMETIYAELTEREANYPGAPIWDRSRSLLADRLLDSGHLQVSLDLVHGMHSRHLMADALMNLIMRDEDNVDVILRSFIRRFESDSTTDRRVGLIQAIIDQSIANNPDSPLIDGLESLLASQVPNYDPLQSWADSHRELHPKFDWDTIVMLIKDEEKWQDVPLHYRQCSMLVHFVMHRAINNEVSTELVMGIIEDLDATQDQFPNALAWDTFKAVFGDALLRQGYPAFALDFGRAIKDAPTQQMLVTEFITQGDQDAALELACVIKDPTILWPKHYSTRNGKMVKGMQSSYK